MAPKNPGSTFTSFPNGKAPPKYAPHAQRSLDLLSNPQGSPAQRALDLLKAVVGAPAQRTLELKTSPQGPPSQRTLELKKEPQGPPAQRTLDLKKSTAETGDADPWGNYYFALEITAEGKTVEVAHFMECSGMKNAGAPFEIREGGNNWNLWRRPAQSKWDNLVLKAGASKSTFFMHWRNEFIEARFEKRKKYSGSVALMNNHGEVLRRFHFTNAWPVSFEGPSGAASGSDIAMESLELAHDGLYTEDPGSAATRKEVELG